GTPQAIYGNPQTLFVATFVGTLNSFAAGPALEALLGQLGRSAAGAATWAVRPEHLGLAQPGAASPAGAALLDGVVTKFTYLGREAHVAVDTPAGHLVVQLANPGMAASSAVGDKVSIIVTPNAPMAFDAAGK